MKNILEYVDKYKNVLETFQRPEVLSALQLPKVQKALDDPGVRFCFFATYECLIKKMKDAKKLCEKSDCEKEMAAVLRRFVNPSDKDKEANSFFSRMLKPAHFNNWDKLIKRIEFCGDALDVVEAIDKKMRLPY